MATPSLHPHPGLHPVAQLQPCREQKSKDTFTGENKMLSFDTLRMNGNEQSLVPVSHTVHGVLKARILKWIASPFLSEPHFVITLHHDPSVLGGPTQHGS